MNVIYARMRKINTNNNNDNDDSFRMCWFAMKRAGSPRISMYNVVGKVKCNTLWLRISQNDMGKRKPSELTKFFRLNLNNNNQNVLAVPLSMPTLHRRFEAVILMHHHNVNSYEFTHTTILSL